MTGLSESAASAQSREVTEFWDAAPSIQMQRPTGVGDGDRAPANGRHWITFRLPGEVGADFASVVGDFNDWDPTRGTMIRDQTDGSFECSLPIEGGRRYQYRFLLDGARWVNDWEADTYWPNVHGRDDSVLDLRDLAPDWAE